MTQFDSLAEALRQKSWDEQHKERVAYRRAHNGQPNGYKPISEAQLQEQKRLEAQLQAAIANAMDDKAA